MLIAILCVNNYSALAAVFGWDIPEPHTTQVQPASPQDNHKAEAGENDIPSINTYRRAHTSSSPLSGHLSDSDESAETPKFGADNTVQPSSDVTVITNHGTATVNPAAGKAPGIGPKPPVITPAPERNRANRKSRMCQRFRKQIQQMKAAYRFHHRTGPLCPLQWIIRR